MRSEATGQEGLRARGTAGRWEAPRRGFGDVRLGGRGSGGGGRELTREEREEGLRLNSALGWRMKKGMHLRMRVREDWEEKGRVFQHKAYKL